MTTFPEPEPLDTGTPQQVADQELLDEVATQVDELEAEFDMDALDNPRRLLLVHAHPDDETVATGATMALHAAAGDAVTLVTCTRGEWGDVVDPDLLDLLPVDAHDDRLGELRVEEIAAAMEALRVTDHRFLGGAGRWRDSGMAGEGTNGDPGCFWQADLDEAVAALVAVIRETRPQVVITYDAHGGYGHPDHIQAHRVTVAAAERAADPTYPSDRGEAWQVGRVLAAAVPRSLLQQAVDEGLMPNLDDMPGVPDEDIAVTVDGTAQRQAKVAAMRAYRSQIDLSQGLWAMLVATPFFAYESYVVLAGTPFAGGPEGDIFAGLDR